jgi:hypothetical protein
MSRMYDSDSAIGGGRTGNALLSCVPALMRL